MEDFLAYTPSPLGASWVISNHYQLAPMDIEEEIQGWKLFGHALRQENRELFEKMLRELDPEMLQSAMVMAKDPFDVLLMALVFHQQKMITRLMKQMKGKGGL